MRLKRTLIVAMAVAMLVASVGLAVAGSTDHENDERAHPDVDVEYRDDKIVVDYDVDGTATLTIEAVDQSYAGEGTYNLSGDGELTLPMPEERVTVDVTLAYRGDSWTETVTLDPEDTPRAAPEEGSLHLSVESGTGDPVVVEYASTVNATLTIRAPDHSWAGEGTYDISGNGTYTLPTPNETMDVTFVVNSTFGTRSHTMTLYADGGVEREWAGDDGWTDETDEWAGDDEWANETDDREDANTSRRSDERADRSADGETASDTASEVLDSLRDRFQEHGVRLPEEY